MADELIKYYNISMRTDKKDEATVNTVIRIPVELHKKLRWAAFRDRRSQHSIIMEILEKGLQKVEVPKEVDK